MFRPLKVLGRCSVRLQVNPYRTKIFYAESFLDRAERLKLWHKENKSLYGSLLETHKAKEKKSAQKEWRKKVPKVLKIDDIHTLAYGPQDALSKTKKTTKHLGDDKKLSTKLEEVLLCMKKTFPEMKSLDAPALNISNMKSVSSKLGKQRIEILSPNIKNNLFNNSFVKVPSIIIRNLKMFPMMSNQKMDIADKKEIDPSDGKILRITSDGSIEQLKFPSVTKILNQTMSEESKAALEKWKQEKIAELGLEGFEKFNKAQLESGKQFHGLIEQHFLSTRGISTIDRSLEGVWSSITPLLKGINSPKAVESHVIHPVLKYKGVIDCIAFYQDKPTLIEWKKSDKPKHVISATYDNPVQLAAYFGAVSHDVNYKQLNIRDALLVIAYTDGSPADAFHLSTDQMRQHWAAWLTRLERYWTANEKIENEKKITENGDKS